MEPYKKPFSKMLEEFVIAAISFHEAAKNEEAEREKNGSYQYCHSYEYRYAEERKKEAAKQVDDYIVKLESGETDTE